MTWRLEITERAVKQIAKLDKPIRERVVRAIDGLATDARPQGATRLVGQDDVWRIRVGDYRILYTVIDQELVVLVVRVAHRSHVYE